MLLYRTLSALVGIPVILLSVWYGDLPWLMLILAIVVMGIIEMCHLWGKINIHTWLPGSLTGGLLFVGAAHWANVDLFGILFLVTILFSFCYLVAVFHSCTFTELAATFFTPIYAGWLLTHMILLRQLPSGFNFVLLVLVATWSTDTFAYFVGTSLGKRKLAPVISPNKSVEGAVGGVAGSVLAALIVGLAGQQLAFWDCVVLGVLVGISGQLGDLVESAFKRMAGVKDSGKLIPGHGGILDRFDSLYFTAPIVYYYIELFTIK